MSLIAAQQASHDMAAVAMRSHAAGLQPIPVLQNSLTARPGTDTVALLTRHQAVLLQLQHSDSDNSSSNSTRNGTSNGASASDAASCPTAGTGGPALEPRTLMRLCFGSGDAICCAAWDAGGAWLAVGTTQQLHLYRAGDGGDGAAVTPVGSMHLRFTPKVKFCCHVQVDSKGFAASRPDHGAVARPEAAVIWSVSHLWCQKVVDPR